MERPNYQKNLTVWSSVNKVSDLIFLLSIGRKSKYLIGENGLKQIKKYINEVIASYYLCEDGRVFDSDNNMYIKANKEHKISLCTESGKKRKYTLKKLYRFCYDEEFIYNEIPCEDGEEWRVIPNTNKCYYVSNRGRVFTKNKKYFGYIMIPVETRDGYLRIQITIDGKKKDKYIHDLVAESFVYKPYPIPLKGYHVHHKDKQKKNCDSENLCYLTPQQHKRLHDKEYKFISEEE